MTQLEIMPRPPGERPDAPAVADLPDDLPGLLAPTRRAATGSTPSRPSEFLGDEPGGSRRCGSSRSSWSTDGAFEPVAGTEREIPAELVLLAMGFTGPERAGCVEQLGVELDARGNVARDASYADHRAAACSSPATPAAASR